MPPTRKTKSVKRFAALNEASSEKYAGGSTNKKQQRKKKLSDKMGPQWSKGELQRFYDAYRKHGKDWRKVAAAVRNRSVDMVEALYNMNRAYLSLPEGTASVVGLIAMMTDHYNVMEGSDSERESNEVLGSSQKSQKRKLLKDQFAVLKDNLQSHSRDSVEGCLSLLKRRRLDDGEPRAVGKRTPRFPVSYSHKKDGGEAYASPIRKGRKSGGGNDDEIAHVAALLTEASQRGGSPQISQMPYRRHMHINSSSVQSSERMHSPQEKAKAAHLRDVLMEEGCLEVSIGSRGGETGDYIRDSLEGVGTVDIHGKRKEFYGKKGKVKDIGNHQFDDGGEACSGTEEGLNASSRGKDDTDVSHKGERFSQQGQRKRKKKLYFGDESSCLDALQTLADLSLMMPDPEPPMESGLSVQLKNEATELDMEDKSSVPEATSTSQSRNKSKLAGTKQRVPVPTSGIDSKKSKLGKDPAFDINAVSESEQQLQSNIIIGKRKRKPTSKMLNSEVRVDFDRNEPSKTEVFAEEENKPVTKGKRTNQISTPSKQWKSFQSEGSLNSDSRRTGTCSMVSSEQLPTASQVNLPPKRSRRKNLPTLHTKEKSSDKNLKTQLNVLSSSLQDRALYQKEKIQHCLSSHLVRRWCTFEWFYSALDYPWFARREFEEYLNHVGLGHIPRLTRVEWGVIRSSLGKPRRFSEHYLRGEREKLKQYRESVRKHYAELKEKGLPEDLAKPLNVGQRVIALHPKTREVHDGKVLTADNDKCRVQFDRPEIGVEFVMDVDCMPLNPLDNMPEALKRQIEKSFLTFKESNKNGNLNFGGPMMFASSGHLDKGTIPVNTSIKQGKGDMNLTTLLPQGASADIGSAQQTAYNQRVMVTHNQAREDDVQALSELNRALDKKEALLTELRNTNNILENQNSGECSLKDSEPFKKHYATVLVLLKEASGQASSAVFNLRQRNTYPANALPSWQKPPGNSTVYGGLPTSFDTSISQESGASVTEIVEGSRLKAHTMVTAAIQAMSSRKGGEEAYVRIREAIDSIDYQHLTLDSRLPIKRSQEQVNGNVGNRNLLISGEADPCSTGESSGPKLHTDTDKNEAQVLSEVITACVMAVHMIQTCTERQYPPDVVARVLDHAVTSLHPRCPQNVGIYREIQMCMGRIKTQILALVPT